MGIVQIAPLFIAVGSLATATLAYLSFRHVRAASVRDTTVNLIVRMTADEHLTNVFDRFRCLRIDFEQRGQANPGLDVVKAHTFVWQGKPVDPTRVIRDMYNFYEAVALGVNEGWLNEKIFKSYWKSSYVADFRDFEKYVDEYRTAYDVKAAFSEYQRVVDRWSKS